MNMLIEYRKHLESKLRKARAVRNNYTRMVEEAIIDINKRAEEQKENISAMFTNLITIQEQEIAALQEELGIGKKDPEPLPVFIEGSDHAVAKPILSFGAMRPGIKKKGGKDVQPKL